LASGVAGDMLLGALIDLGLPLDELSSVIRRAARLKDFSLVSRRTERALWPARDFVVKGDRPFGDFRKMSALLERAALPKPVRDRALQVLARLDHAESKVHRARHSHWDPKGIGLFDTFVDVLGTSWGFWKLGIERAVVSPVHAGRMAPATA